MRKVRRAVKKAGTEKLIVNVENKKKFKNKEEKKNMVLIFINVPVFEVHKNVFNFVCITFFFNNFGLYYSNLLFVLVTVDFINRTNGISTKIKPYKVLAPIFKVQSSIIAKHNKPEISQKLSRSFVFSGIETIWNL